MYHLKPLPGHLLYQVCFTSCNVVWGPTTLSLPKLLGYLYSHFQNKFLLVRDSFVKLILVEQWCLHTDVWVFKVLHQFCSGYLRDSFIYAETTHIHKAQNGQNSRCYLFHKVMPLLVKWVFLSCMLLVIVTYIYCTVV